MFLLNIGCGSDIKKDYINLDKYPKNGSIYFDMEDIPWKFDNNSIDKILMSHVIEHSIRQDEIIAEALRILKVDGILEIFVPHWKNVQAWGNIEHKRPYNFYSFDDIHGFKVLKKKIKHKFKIIQIIANKFPKCYEQCISSILPSQEIYYLLVKE